LTGQYKVVRSDNGLLQGQWTYVLSYGFPWGKEGGDMTFVSSGGGGVQIITFDLPETFAPGVPLPNAHEIATATGMGAQLLEGACALK
jgi:hypothetical protein